MPASHTRGSVETPPTRTRRCRCGPVESPVEPCGPNSCPAATASPCATERLARCIDWVTTPDPWSICTMFPAPPAYPANVTVPAATARTGGEPGAAKSSPSCISAPRKYRIPYSLVIAYRPRIGAVTAPAASCTPAPGAHTPAPVLSLGVSLPPCWGGTMTASPARRTLPAARARPFTMRGRT